MLEDARYDTTGSSRDQLSADGDGHSLVLLTDAWSYYPKFFDTQKIEKIPFRVKLVSKSDWSSTVVLLSGDHCIANGNPAAS